MRVYASREPAQCRAGSILIKITGPPSHDQTLPGEQIDKPPAYAEQHGVALPPFMHRALWGLAVACVSISCILGFRYSTSHLSDFTGYYAAAKIVATRDSVEQMYDDEWFKQRVRSFAIPESTFVMYVNPPPVSFIMVPLTVLEPFRAKFAWNILSVSFLFLAFFAVRTRLNPAKQPGYDALLLSALGAVPFLRNLQRGQLYVLLLVIVVFLWIAYEQRRHWLAGVCLASLLLLKYFGWMFMILFLVERRWKDALTTALLTLCGFLVTALVLGLAIYQRHLEGVIAGLRNMDAAFTGLPCIPAFFGSLFVRHPEWNPSPVAHLPWLATLLTALSLVAALALTYRRRKSEGHAPSRMFLAVLVLSVIFTPLAADHHYILLVPAAFLMMSETRWNEISPARALLILAVAYGVLGWLPSFPARLASGWMKLLSFPHLYAAVALWSLLLFPPKSTDRREHDPA
jgi:hypothetical protein